MNINITIPVTITVSLFSIGLLGAIAYILKEPDKCEKALRLVTKVLRYFSKKAELYYVKYDIQSKLNGFIKTTKKDVPNLSVTDIRLEWIDENMTQEQFLKSGQMVLRMHNSRNPNRNIMNATLAFVSYSLLIKAKYYLSKYQKTAIDLFASHKILSKENPAAVGELIDCYLRKAMDNHKVNLLYTQFTHIDEAGLFFPIYVNELNFLGEKIFGTAVKKDKIYDEVNNLAAFLNNYSNRKLSQETTNEFTGNHCRFAIRIVGKKYKVDTEGSKVYVNNILKIHKNVETIYLLGDSKNKEFINQVVSQCLKEISYWIYNKKEYRAKIKGIDGTDFECVNYLVILRSKSPKTFYEK